MSSDIGVLNAIKARNSTSVICLKNREHMQGSQGLTAPLNNKLVFNSGYLKSQLSIIFSWSHFTVYFSKLKVFQMVDLHFHDTCMFMFFLLLYAVSAAPMCRQELRYLPCESNHMLIGQVTSILRTYTRLTACSCFVTMEYYRILQQVYTFPFNYFYLLSQQMYCLGCC